MKNYKNGIHTCICPQCREVPESSYHKGKDVEDDNTHLEYIKKDPLKDPLVGSNSTFDLKEGNKEHETLKHLQDIIKKKDWYIDEIEKMNGKLIAQFEEAEECFYSTVSSGCKDLILKLVKFDALYPGELQSTFLDWLDVIPIGAKKHGPRSWLEPNNDSMKMRNNLGSISSHVALAYTKEQDLIEYYNGMQYSEWKKDNESDLLHELHAVCRLMMQYHRKLEGIEHQEDKNE
jgi:hypothetical protein